MRNSQRSVPAFTLSVICLVLGAAPAIFGIAWDAPAFSLTPAGIAAAAAQVTAKDGSDVVVLYEEDSYSYDAKAAAVHTYRVIYRILTRDGISRWSTASCTWQPWRQDKPSIQARVISRSGDVFQLDQRTIADSTARPDDPDLYTDSRVLQAPLPDLDIGCIVEYLITLTDRAPLLGASGNERIWMGYRDPVLTRRLLVDYPSSLALQYAVRGPGAVPPTKSESAGRVALRFEETAFPGITETEDYLTSDTILYPCVDISTGASWAEVARAYAAITDPMLDGAPLAAYSASALAGTPAGSASTARIAAILARIRKDVRYTGIDFGENAIVPHPALDTLARGYGDCKDQAVLLAACLRAAGIDARLALLQAGSDPDVLPGLPGISMFNHAIVYLPAQKTWIDPTAGFYPSGTLPAMDQGRRALIVAADTAALVTTPEIAASANTLTETREFRLAEAGSAAATEVATLSGTFESAYRDHFERSSQSESHDSLESYVKSAYDASALDGFTTSDPWALDTPFRLTLQIKNAGVASTDDSSAVAYLRSGGMFDFLPSFLVEAGDAGKSFTRTNDMRLWEPYREELIYRIVPPPGYRAAALPPNRSDSFGPSRFSQTFSLATDGSVTGDFVFDCVKRVFTPAETVALHTAIRALLDSNAQSITFEQVGESDLAAGQYQQALDEFRALAAAHPAEALHHVQLSRALLAAGFGAESEAEARLAVQREPSSASAHSNLAWVLLHDAFGRIFGPGTVLAGARAEYAKAAELDATDTYATTTLAILCEYNDELVRYGAGADLGRAIDLYRSVASSIKDSDTWNNLIIDLFRAGRMSEVRSELATTARNATQQALFVAAVAAQDGTAAAQREAVRLVPSAADRRTVLSGAGSYLLQMRLYPQSAALLVAGASGTQSLTQTMALADILKSLTVVDPSALTTTTPQALFLSILSRFTAADNDVVALARFISPSESALLANPDDMSDITNTFSGVRSELTNLQFPSEIILDLAAKLFTFQTLTDGVATGVLVAAPQFPSTSVGVLYMTHAAAGYRLLDSDQVGSGIARECLALLDAGKLDDARAWVRLLRTQHAKAAAFPDLSKDPFFSLLPGSGEPSAADIRRAAGFALARSSSSADKTAGAAILLPVWKAETNRDTRVILEAGLSSALNALGRANDLLDVTDAYLRDAPDEPAAMGIRALALTHVSRPAEAEAILANGVRAKPGDAAMSRLLVDFLGGTGRYAEAVKEAARTLDTGSAEIVDYNDFAWYSLFLGVPDRAQIDGRQIVQRLMDGDEAVLHTLVCVLADSGRFLEAQEVFGKYLDERGNKGPDSSTWLAFGIMAERFGLRDTAIAAYRKVLPSDTTWYVEGSSYVLAQRHLNQMGVAK